MLRIIILGLIGLCLAACTPTDTADPVSALPEGDPQRGADLFAQTLDGVPACSTCHLPTDEQRIGPGLQNYAHTAANRVEGQSAEVYTYNSIVLPAAYIVPGYSNVMYTRYADALTDQQVADLIAYLLTFD